MGKERKSMGYFILQLLYFSYDYIAYICWDPL